MFIKGIGLCFALTIIPLAAIGNTAQKIPVQNTHLAPEHLAALKPYLTQNRNLRVAEIADFPDWNVAKADILAIYSNRHPYYAVGDFNGDKRTDFAVVLIDRLTPAMPRNASQPERFYNASVVVFNGSANGFSNKPVFRQKWGLIQSSLLFFQKSDRTLMVGQWEGSIAQVQPTIGGNYRFYFGE